jgi:hypothetical protein
MGEASPSGVAPRSPWRARTVTPPASPHAAPAARCAACSDPPARNAHGARAARTPAQPLHSLQHNAHVTLSCTQLATSSTQSTQLRSDACSTSRPTPHARARRKHARQLAAQHAASSAQHCRRVPPCFSPWRSLFPFSYLHISRSCPRASRLSLFPPPRVATFPIADSPAAANFPYSLGSFFDMIAARVPFSRHSARPLFGFLNQGEGWGVPVGVALSPPSDVSRLRAM